MTTSDRPSPASGSHPPTTAEVPLVMLVDDHRLLADSVAAALAAEGMLVVRPSSLDPAAVLDLAREDRPQVVLLDLRLPGDATTLPLVAPLCELGSRVVMVTAETDPERLAECVEAGAVGVVSKSAPFEDLVTAVVQVTGGGTLLSRVQRDEHLATLHRRRAEDHDRLEPFERLTPRERTVLAAVIDGKPAEVIAAEGYVSIATVRSQIRSVLAKLDVHSQLAAVAKARAVGWKP